MDDADLEKLVVKPGKLKPKFNRSTIEYELVLNSGIKEFSLDLFTRDSSASWTIPVRLSFVDSKKLGYDTHFEH